MFTLEAENGRWDINAINRNRNGSFDKGLCQLNSQYHSPFINSKEFKDWRKQIDYCWGVWQDAIKKGRIRTTFYGYNHRYTRSKNKYKCN